MKNGIVGGETAVSNHVHFGLLFPVADLLILPIFTTCHF